MRKLKRLLIGVLVVCVILLLASTLFFIVRPKAAGIFIDAAPAAIVYINNKEVGSTPYRMTQDPGEVVLKLVSKDNSQSSWIPYETRIALQPGVETVVRHSFGISSDTGSGEIISFEAISKKDTSLSIVTIPDGAEIAIDDATKVFAPHKSSNITPGDHTLTVKAKGYAERRVKVKTHEGYKLTAVITLAKIPVNAVITPTPTPTPTQVQTGELVQILQTATGTLRVRKDANTTSEEIGTVKSGESYPFLERDIKTGWFRIAFDGKEGWVSSQYARKVETGSPSVSVSPTKAAPMKPSATPTPTLQPAAI